MRWIFGFKQVGRRALSDAEIEALTRSAGTHATLRYSYGSLAVAIGLIGVISVIEASGGGIHRLAWIVFAACVIGFFYVLGLASKAEAVGLLKRRAARVGQVDIFERTEVPMEVRIKFRMWPNADHEDDPIECAFWKEDEKLLEWVRKVGGKSATRFETPIDDDVLIFVEGRQVQQVKEVFSVLV